jgi:DNA-binding transcriptional LysR family regulator
VETLAAMRDFASLRRIPDLQAKILNRSPRRSLHYTRFFLHRRMTNMIDKLDGRQPLPPFTALRAFEAVGRLGGIRRAANALQIDHAVVSRHIRVLEEWAGLRLLDRLQGGAVLTGHGIAYHRRIAAAFAELTSASMELSGGREDGRLSIWCVHGFACRWLTSHLNSFQYENPDIDLELRPTDAAADFNRFEADVDIRYVLGQEPILATTVSGGVRRFEIARPDVIPVASPRCAGRLSPVRSAADLLNAPLLHEESHLQWQAWFTSHGLEAAGLLRGPRLWHAHLTVEAALQDQGVALTNRFLVGNDLASGRLLPLMSDADSGAQVALGAYVFAARADRWQSPPIVRFRHWLKRATTDARVPVQVPAAARS